MDSPVSRQLARRSTVPMFALLAVGIVLLFQLGLAKEGARGQAIAVAVAVAVVAIAKPLRLGEKLANAQKILSQRINVATGAVFLITASYFLCSALAEGRKLYPRSHDAQAHLLQAVMMAHGRLWMPQHPVADFFETFFVLSKPVYAPIFFPGTALVNVPGVWLHWRTWVIPWLLSSAAVAVVFRLGAELMDPLIGLLMAVLVVDVVPFRMLSFDLMSHPVMMLLGGLTLLMFVRWWRGGRMIDLAILGIVTGLAAITRPDAMCYAIPTFAAVVYRIVIAEKHRATAIIVLALCLSPFVALQLVFNHGVTGKWFETPYTYYLHEFQPGTEVGFARFDPQAQLKTQIVQKQSYFRRLLLPYIQRHNISYAIGSWMGMRGEKLAKGVFGGCSWLVCLIPIALLGIGAIPRLVSVIVILLMIGLYTANPVYLDHYAVGFLPVLAIAMGIAIEEVRLRFPAVKDLILLTCAALLVAGLPEIRHEQMDWPAPTVEMVREELPKMVKAPAVVLFSYRDDFKSLRPLVRFHEEPVYNSEVLNPDDAPIINAHDLGLQRDREIFEYYAERQPERQFWLFDRMNNSITPLGNARELARKYPTTRP